MIGFQDLIRQIIDMIVRNLSSEVPKLSKLPPDKIVNKFPEADFLSLYQRIKCEVTW